MEYEIVKFLNDLNRDDLSENSKRAVRSYIRICSELESLGDSGEAISRTINNMNAYDRHLSQEHIASLSKMTGLLSQAYEDMIYNLEHETSLEDIANAETDEKAINTYRNERRDFELSRIESSGEGYFEAVFYLNILDALEKMGDFLINISQALQGVSRKAE